MNIVKPNSLRGRDQEKDLDRLTDRISKDYRKSLSQSVHSRDLYRSPHKDQLKCDRLVFLMEFSVVNPLLSTYRAGKPRPYDSACLAEFQMRQVVGWVERKSDEIRAKKEDFRCFILSDNVGNLSETQHFIAVGDQVRE